MASSAPSRRVFATRPERQNGAWAASLRDDGWAVCELPLLALVPLSAAPAVQAIKDRVLQLDNYHCLIFVSQNAVHCAFDWIGQYWPQFPLGVRSLAVGAQTAAALAGQLRALNAGPDAGEAVQAFGEDEPMTSETLLASPALQGLAGKKVLIFRGCGGRPTLADALRERGAEVDYCELYQRQLPAGAAAQLLHFGLRDGDIVPLFSGESLENFQRLRVEQQLGAAGLTLIVPSARVAELARALGFSQIVTASNASAPAMRRALAACDITQPSRTP